MSKQVRNSEKSKKYIKEFIQNRILKWKVKERKDRYQLHQEFFRERGRKKYHKRKLQKGTK